MTEHLFRKATLGRSGSGRFLPLKSCGFARIRRPLTGRAVAQKLVLEKCFGTTGRRPLAAIRQIRLEMEIVET
jgi:hypothetical protein